jgi:hypothetical protein
VCVRVLSWGPPLLAPIFSVEKVSSLGNIAKG